MTELEKIARTLAGQLNDAFDQALLDADEQLRMSGATEYERLTYLEACRAELAAWRTRTFSEVFERIRRDGSTLH